MKFSIIFDTTCVSHRNRNRNRAFAQLRKEPQRTRKAAQRFISCILAISLLGLLSGCAEFSEALSQTADLAGQYAPQLAPEIAPGSTQYIKDAAKVTKATAEAINTEMGPVQEYELGREVSARLLGAYTPLPQTDPAAQYLEQVGAAVALASNNPYPYADYTFILLDSAEINAFAAPGGFVFVTTGMLKFLQSEEELAAILGHEVAHVELQHGIQSIGKENAIKLAGVAKDVALEETSAAGYQLEGFAQQAMDDLMGKMLTGIRQGYNVEMESAADRRSIEISQALGYDPAALPGLLARFKQVTHSYGGANYPAEREAEARAHLQAIGAAPAPRNPVRDQRYAQSVATLK